MLLTLTIAICAMVAVFGATGMYFLFSKMTSQSDDVEQMEYTALRSFLQECDESTRRHADETSRLSAHRSDARAN